MTFSDWGPPKHFGWHPDLSAQIKSIQRRARKTGNAALMWGKHVALKDLEDERHPEVTVIPSGQYLDVLDCGEDHIEIMKIRLPFSSTDFYAELYEHDGTVFYELWHAEPFIRLSRVSQLGYLVPPRPEDWDPNQNILYLPPTFSHTRSTHSLLVACLMEVVLARNGFGQKERDPVVLMAGCHDIAMPAGGDPIQAMDPDELDEEKNFSLVLTRYGLDRRWEEMFGFNLEEAQEWVVNGGLFGQLLDVVDKIAYTALDCFHVGRARPGRIRDFCLEHPLLMDVWEDIRFTKDRKRFGFVSPERLYDFLKLRALEHTEFLQNPEARRVDLTLVRLLKPLYEKGEITKEDLLFGDNDWLEAELGRRFPDRVRSYVEPDLLGWKSFRTEEERDEFCRSLGEDRVERTEEILPFRPGLHLPVLTRDGTVHQLREVLAPERVAELEQLAQGRVGYTVYYYR